jgi:antitoxin PrlF
MMAHDDQKESPCATRGKDFGCCSVESVVSVDERGQMVLPKDIRDKAGICPGDKLVVIAMKRDGKFCCLSLIKAQDFEGFVANLITSMNPNAENKKKDKTDPGKRNR